uniref:Uncharacterized protein n=1 Tax=Amphimedon queenslandica TaxID=400682 RepID=A0A1X7VWA7_AMPQE
MHKILLKETGALRDDMLPHRDEVFEELRKADDSIVSQGDVGGMTIELLQLLFQAFSVCTKRLLADHLPGGKFYSVVDDNQMVSETASVPTTNVSPESNFAILDRFLRKKPNANMIALETMILYSYNQSSIWLEKMMNEDREKLFQAARSVAPVI